MTTPCRSNLDRTLIDETYPCRNCGCVCHWQHPRELTGLEQAIPKPTICSACYAAGNPAPAQTMDAPWLQMWRRLCPTEYQETVFARLPDRGHSQEVLDHPYCGQGLLLLGPSRTGKTRTAWLWLREVMPQHPRLIAKYDVDFAEAGQKAAHELRGGEWKHPYIDAEILFVDDFGKAKATEFYDAQLWRIIEGRTSHGRPTILTTQLTCREMIEGASERHYGEALVQRLAEFCRIVKFRLPPKEQPHGC